MVVSNLSVIGDPLYVRRMRQAAKNRHFPTDHLNHLTGSSLLVIGDEPVSYTHLDVYKIQD